MISCSYFFIEHEYVYEETEKGIRLICFNCNNRKRYRNDLKVSLGQYIEQKTDGVEKSTKPMVQITRFSRRKMSVY